MSPRASTVAARGRYDSPRSYFRVVFPTLGRKAWLALGLMILVSLTEWIGLLLLVPLLAIAGLDVGSGMVGRVAEITSSAFAFLGLRPSLLAVLAVYLSVVSARALLQRRQSLAIADLERSLVLHFRSRLYRAVAFARWGFLCRTRSSDLLHALVGLVSTVGQATQMLLSMIASVLIGMVYLLFALKLSLSMTLLACASGLGLVILLRKGAKRAREAGGRTMRTSAGLLSAATEHLAGMKTTKSCSAEERNIAVFERLTKDAAEVQMVAVRNHATVSTWFQIGSVVLLGVLLYAAVTVWALSTAELLLLLFLFSRLVPRFSALQLSYQHLVSTVPAFSRFMTLVEHCEAEAEARGSNGKVIGLESGITLERVFFGYGSDHGLAALEDVNLFIPARRTTAIIGPSGAGKSTIADMVMGLILPQRGQLLIDGVPLSSSSMQGWREQIGYVTQDTFLLHDTIRANLLWASPGATEDELWAALTLAAADGYVRALPAGLDTIIGDRGVLMSGGERQRLALARAVLRRPALLILDEATSALDSENERRIQRAIDALHGQMTILVITHRLSTIRPADVIHVVEKGHVVDSGTWESMLIRGGRFAELCAAQGLRFDRTTEPTRPEARRVASIR